MVAATTGVGTGADATGEAAVAVGGAARVGAGSGAGGDSGGSWRRQRAEGRARRSNSNVRVSSRPTMAGRSGGSERVMPCSPRCDMRRGLVVADGPRRTSVGQLGVENRAHPTTRVAVASLHEEAPTARRRSQHAAVPVGVQRVDPQAQVVTFEKRIDTSSGLTRYSRRARQPHAAHAARIWPSAGVRAGSFATVVRLAAAGAPCGGPLGRGTGRSGRRARRRCGATPAGRTRPGRSIAAPLATACGTRR